MISLFWYKNIKMCLKIILLENTSNLGFQKELNENLQAKG